MEYISVSFSACSLLFVIVLLINYFSKKRVNNFETRTYSFILITNFLLLLTDVVGYFMYNSPHITENLKGIVSKIYLSIYIIYGTLFTYYSTLVIVKNTKHRKIFNIIHLSIAVITLVLSLVLPIGFTGKDFIIPTGPSINVAYIYAFFLILYLSIISLTNVVTIIKEKNKKTIPIIVLILLSMMAVYIQYYYSNILLIITVDTLTTFIMYYTIENPDLKMLEEVTTAKNQAEKSNRAKSDFLSSMSHEIRTPLNAIVGLSEDIATYKDNVPPEVIEDTVDIQNASQTLLEIVGNILDINKIEADKMEVIDTTYNFKEEITNMCKVTATRIGEKNIKFTLNISPTVPYELIGDKGKVKTIINNFLTNAIKYTTEGEIKLDIKSINNIENATCDLVVICKDTGKGIKEELTSRLFTKFDRLDIEKNGNTEGTGLGLAITKSMIDMMGGTIEVVSTEGAGSIFSCTIPQKIGSLYGNEEMEVITFNNPVNNIKESLTEEVKEEKSNSQKKILIVDDNALNIKVAQRSLKDFDFMIEEAHDGSESVEKVKSGNKYDLILMDIMMPNMNGEEALKHLKEIEGFNTPVIALTADAVAGAKEKYISEGFIDYLSKPFSREQIKEKLDVIFK